MSELGRPCNFVASRKRSDTVAVARDRIASHAVGRQATTAVVRRMFCRIDIRPCATCSTSLLSAPPSPRTSGSARSAPCASSVSIWSIASTAGPASATSQEMSRTHSCGDNVETPMDHCLRPESSTSSAELRYACPTSCTSKSSAPRRTSARRVWRVWPTVAGSAVRNALTNLERTSGVSGSSPMIALRSTREMWATDDSW